MQSFFNTSLTLLYAEDEDAIRISYTKYFEKIFKEVYQAKDGKEAYELYLQKKPNIILCDINMPHMSGLELIQKIRLKDKQVKAIVLSAYKDEEKLLQAIPLGLSHYLLKPIKKRDLDYILHKVIAEIKTENTNFVKLDQELYWDKENTLLFKNNQLIHLTKNEIILMSILSSGFQAHYSLDDILESFWQHQTQKEITESSIRNIIKRLKQKLPPGSIENQYALGYKLKVF